MPEFPENKPYFLQLDNDVLAQKADEALFNKNWSFDTNRNNGESDGTNNPSNSGQNQFVLTPVQSNVEIPNALLPAGYNRAYPFESVVSNEVYVLIYNENANHSIFVIDGNTLSITKVITDGSLQFSDNQEAFIANHRVILRVVYGKQKEILEKFLIVIDGNTWQKFVNVMAAIATDGFNAAQFPYWDLQPPHFDRRELVEYAVRPPMIPIVTQPIANTVADKGLPNRQIDKAFRASYKFYYTDGRETAIAPWSLPFYVKREDYLNNPELLPKKTKFTLYAGSCMVERIEIYLQVENGEWYKYDTIGGYPTAGSVIGTPYWTRTNKWANFNYDPIQNTIDYVFDNTKVGQIVDQQFITRIQNDIPIRSVAMSPLGDGTLLGNNEIGFDNFDASVTNKFDITVLQRAATTCNVPLVNITLYAYSGLMGDHVDNINFISQVGYYNGEDKQMRFGGIQIKFTPVIYNAEGIRAEVDQSKQFNLDFADRKNLRCYLIGTPYYADGIWCRVLSNGSVIEIDNDLDITNATTQSFIYETFKQGGYFISKFKFTVPAGQYRATLGRHNVASNADWINTSTYIVGIANSQLTSTEGQYLGLSLVRLLPNNYLGSGSSIVSDRKDLEIDCRAGDVDVWGNGADLFYVFVPSPLFEDSWPEDEEDHWCFLEGYVREQVAGFPMETYPYRADEDTSYLDNQFNGAYTDKNGFFFQYSGRGLADQMNVMIWGNKNCTYFGTNDFFMRTNEAGNHRGWTQVADVIFKDFNGGVVGDCNRIKIVGKITNLAGTIGYSGVSIGISYGSYASTNDDGEFTLIAHRGIQTAPTRYLFVNAGGDYVITLTSCTLLDKYNYTEPACVDCTLRQFTLADIPVFIEGGGQQSLKSEAKYPVGIIGADYAGRVTFVNFIKDVNVTSFMDLGVVSPSYLQWFLSSSQRLFPDDIKWLCFAVAKDTSRLKYVQWVGDNISYLDSSGNVVTDTASAKLIQIGLGSLLNANIASNFSLLANYNFVQGDRLRVFDNGDGTLFTTAIYGDPIDTQIVGTTYSQAAINAGLLPTTTTVTPLTTEPVIIVEYSSKISTLLDKKKGFWIEIYSPSQVNAELPYFEADRWFPVINNKIAEYVSGGVANPVYTYPTTGVINYWDTYFLRRGINIQGIGNRYFQHPFESPNITDNWGKDVSSGGRPNSVNLFAQRKWYIEHTIKSDDLTISGVKNGLGTFRASNIKEFKGFGRGGIVAIISQYSLILFICENDYFITDFNFKYIYANPQGVQVANLDDKLSEPHQKIGSNYGCAYEHTGTVLMEDKIVGWYDGKNGQYVICNYNDAQPISDAGIKAYLIEKSVFISRWNFGKQNKDKFDVVAGLDYQNRNIHLTFRPRRNNSTSALSFVNRRRDWAIDHQETLVYDLDTSRWTRSVGFTQESYIGLRGNGSVQEFFSFFNGRAWYHNNTPSTNNFCSFNGVQTELVLKFAINDSPELVKYLKTLAYDCLGIKLYADLIYSSQKNSFSYIPLSLFKTKKKVNYAAVLRDASGYPNYNTPSWLSILIDGMKKVFGQFFVVRIIGSVADRGKYGELSSLFKRTGQSGNNKK